MDSLGTDGRGPELLKARLRRSRNGSIGVGCGRVCASLSDGLAGVGGLLAEGIEETETGSERHDCSLVVCVRLSGDVREVALEGKERASLLLAFRRYLEVTRCRNAEQERSLSLSVCRFRERVCSV